MANGPITVDHPSPTAPWSPLAFVENEVKLCKNISARVSKPSASNGLLVIGMAFSSDLRVTPE